MKRTIRLLLITDEVWNDQMYPNNNMTNWFTDFDNIEIANIYCSEGIPDNKCCSQYYQITDKMMLFSLLGRGKAGIGFEKSHEENIDNTDVSNVKPSAFKRIVDKISSTHSDIFRLIRDCIWLFGKYDIKGMTKFIKEFAPDLIFTQRVGSVKLCRLERVIKKIAGCPMLALTGDNEYSLKMINFSPFFWIRRLMVHNALNKTIPYYDMYYTSSQEQADIYNKKFNIPTALMFKCGKPDHSIVHKSVHSPIRIVYVGKLYCGRWKTLAMLGDAVKKVNCNEVKVIIEIYTRDKVTKKQEKFLNDGRNIMIKGAADPKRLSEIYKKNDIVLHVESLDFINRLITQHSYSTKVVDCLSSGCAVMAIGWKKHSACIELKKNNAALIATTKKEVRDLIQEISKNPNVITKYAKQAMNDVEENHSRNKIQEQLYDDFLRISKRGES